MAGRQTGRIIKHPVIRAVTLTGSKAAGQAVAAQAGKLLIKTVLDLGGSDPVILLEDADLEKTVESRVASRLLNSGQSCIAAKRFVVVKDVYQQFVQMFVEKRSL
jgi:succinate-semialdehyde dehydrogenase/glutarate-semialdehyde dehydrogenase